jgi:thioredoxin-like negative regulator of GroEL
MTEIHLFVQEGCRPCMYAETQLKKVEGWENAVTITNAKENGVLTEFAKECEVKATPTLIALVDGVPVAKMTGSQNMTSDFWRDTIRKHGS